MQTQTQTRSNPQPRYTEISGFQVDLQSFLDELNQYDIMHVAELSGLHFTTLYLWLRRKHTPSLRALKKCAPIIGWELRLRPMQKH